MSDCVFRFYSHKCNIRPGQVKKLDLIDDCWIPLHEPGTYGYVLCRLIALGGHHDSKFIVYSKGVGECENILLDDLLQLCHGRPLYLEVVGAGLIENNIKEKTLKVWGSRPHFPKPDHSITANLLRRFAPHYDIVTWSNDGKPTITRKESVKVAFVPEPVKVESEERVGFEPWPEPEVSEVESDVTITADSKDRIDIISTPVPDSEPEPEPEPITPDPPTPDPQPEEAPEENPEPAP